MGGLLADRQDAFGGPREVAPAWASDRLIGDLDAGGFLVKNRGGEILQASHFAGANAGYKIAAALAALPATGGVVDARGLTGPQTINADPFLGVTKPVTVLLGAAIYTVSSPGGVNSIEMHSNQRLIGSGKGVTVLRVGSGDGNAVISIAANSADCEIMDLTIDGDGYLTTHQFGILVNAGSVRPAIRNVVITGLKCTQSQILVADSTYGKFSEIHLAAAGRTNGHGFTIQNAAPLNNYHTLANVTVLEAGMAFHLLRANRNLLVNCAAMATGLNSFEGFNLGSSSENSFTNITAIGRGDAGYVETHDPAEQPGERNHLNGGIFRNNACDGVGVDCVDGVYENIVTSNNGQSPTAPNHGVYVGAYSLRATLRNVYAFDDQATVTQVVGIHIATNAESTAAGTIIEGARFQGVTIPLEDLGNGTVYDLWLGAAKTILAQGMFVNMEQAYFGIRSVANGLPASDNGANAQLAIGAHYSGLSEVDFFNTNNAGTGFKFMQKTAAGTKRDVVWFDNNNTAGNVPMLLWDPASGTQKRVTVGANDSGGAGYKVLRMAN